MLCTQYKTMMHRPAAAKATAWRASTRQYSMPCSRRVCKVYAVAEEVAATKSGMVIRHASHRLGLSKQLVSLLYNPLHTARTATVKRETKETKVEVSINLDGTGVCTSQSQIPFLDHMMDVRGWWWWWWFSVSCSSRKTHICAHTQQLASHGLFNVIVQAEGDTWIDDHHTNEDIALALGTALAQALGDRKGIRRFGDFSAPLDEALVHVVLVWERVCGMCVVCCPPKICVLHVRTLCTKNVCVACVEKTPMTYPNTHTHTHAHPPHP